MSRSYGVYSRNKLPRNKYGIIYDQYTLNGSSSVFGSNESAAVVGDVMANLSEFVGASNVDDGTRGLVPAPLAGQQDYFLQATGAWIDIPAYRWMSEFPTSGGLEKSGLNVSGDLNVENTLTAMNLKVEGVAEFWSLIVDKVKSSGGQTIISPSSFTVDSIGDVIYYPLTDTNVVTLLDARKDIYNIIRSVGVSAFKCRRLYQRNDDGSKAITSEVVIGDMLRCKTFNIDGSGVYSGVNNTDYWSFVLGVGNENFIDETGNSISAIYIDLVYSLRLESGENLPLGSLLRIDGTYYLPEGYSDVVYDPELKRVSYQTLTGLTDVEPEVFDNEELDSISNKVYKIRGLSESINTLTGERSLSVNSDDIDSDTLSQASQQLQFITEGTTTNENADPSDLTSLILNGIYSENPSPDDNEDDTEEGTEISRNIRSAAPRSTSFDKGLILDRVVDSKFVIKTGTLTSVALIAGDDLYSGNTKIYDKGDIVPSGTTTLGDWEFYDTVPTDTVLSEDLVTERTTIPPDEDEIRNGTTTTTTGVERNTDSSINHDYDSVTEWKFGYGIFRVRVGDELSSLGHMYNSDRQGAIVLSSTDPIDPELRAPAIAQYSGIETFGESISKYRFTSIARNGNEFFGSFMVNRGGSYVDVEERINLFINDIETGLERVGIHLDGDSSTITLVGSVDLKQHGRDSYDSINVYDNLDIKRVEILPRNIPKRGTEESGIDISRKSFRYVYDSKIATKNYITYSSRKHWYFWPFNSTMFYTYTLNSYKVSLTSSINLGYINSNSELDLSSLDVTLEGNTYLVGKTYVSNHGTGQQEVTLVKYTLKRDGVSVKTGELSTSSGLVISGLNTDTIKLTYTGIFINDYNISTAGTYTLELKVDYKIYATIETGDYYSNYYYLVYTGLSGKAYCSISKNLSSSTDMSQRKMTIGTDGLFFNCNNSRYFYSGSDGYEMKWDSAGIRIDSENGLKIEKLTTITNSTSTINKKYDMVIANYSSSGYTLYLPSAVDYGNGRRMTVLAFRGLKIRTSNAEVVRVTSATGFIDADCIEFGSGSSGSLVMPKYTVELIAVNGSWYITSYY